MKSTRKSFEQAISELEDVVARLEAGEISLEESIEYFQKGIELSKLCNKKLDEAERKITMLLDSGNDDIREEDITGLENGGGCGLQE